MDVVSQRNKQRACRFVRVVLNERRLELLDELVAADYVVRVLGREPIVGRDGLRTLLRGALRTYPDLHVKVEDLLGDEDLVAIRWRATRGCAGAEELVELAGITLVRMLAGMQIDSYTAFAEVGQ